MRQQDEGDATCYSVRTRKVIKSSTGRLSKALWPNNKTWGEGRAPDLGDKLGYRYLAEFWLLSTWDKGRRNSKKELKSGLLCLCHKGAGNHNSEDLEELVKVAPWASNGDSWGKWGWVRAARTAGLPRSQSPSHWEKPAAPVTWRRSQLLCHCNFAWMFRTKPDTKQKQWKMGREDLV